MSETIHRMGLHRAYRQTRYRVTGNGHAFDLAIDRVSPALAHLFREHCVRGGAYLTAYNPRSRPTDGSRNQAMQSRLLDCVREAGLLAIEGHGEDPSGLWPAEESVLVLGAGFVMACNLAREFDQEAMVFAGPDAIPRLALLA